MKKNRPILSLLTFANFEFATATEQFKKEPLSLDSSNKVKESPYQDNIFLAIERVEGKEEGIKKGREIGLQEGEKKKAHEIALNLLSSGMKEKDIIECTGLTLEQLQQLRQKSEQNVR